MVLEWSDARSAGSPSCAHRISADSQFLNHHAVNQPLPIHSMKKKLRALAGSITVILLSAAMLSAQEEPASIAGQTNDAASAAAGAQNPLPQFRVLETKVTQLADRRIIVHRVANPGLPALTPPVAAPPVILPLPLTPAQLAARAARPAPKESRLLVVTVTRYADNLSYIEWSPQVGGVPFGAWSNADYTALSMVPDVELSPGGIRYLIFPFFMHKPAPGPVAPPTFPADGSGFVVVKGDTADTENVSPIAALHKIYQAEGAELKRLAEERERQRREEEGANAGQPPPDIVLHYWQSRTLRRKGGAQ